MQQYPSISSGAKSDPINKPCIAFYKYDGSNLRWEWTPKQGWNKFGTRKHLFDEIDTQFSQAIPIFFNSLADEIVYRSKQIDKNPQRITAFTEFFGAGSFAGSHVESDKKELKLFDVFLFKKGFIPPKQFVQIYGDMPQAAEVIYEGNLTLEFVNDVITGKYPVIEGVICKGSDFMVKIKTLEYLTQLKHRFYDRWQEFV